VRENIKSKNIKGIPLHMKKERKKREIKSKVKEEKETRKERRRIKTDLFSCRETSLDNIQLSIIRDNGGDGNHD
jgi:hypothetical protein